MTDDPLNNNDAPKAAKPRAKKPASAKASTPKTAAQSSAKKSSAKKSSAAKSSAKKSAQDQSPTTEKTTDSTASAKVEQRENPAQYDGGKPMEFNEWLRASYKNVQLNYGLYLLSFLFGPIAVVGLILAYINKDKANDVLQTHYIYQIRTFWIGLGITIIGFITVFFLIGFVILLAGAIWFIIRSVKGLIRVSNSQPIEDPQTWLW